jgi:hypothetical protein
MWWAHHLAVTLLRVVTRRRSRGLVTFGWRLGVDLSSPPTDLNCSVTEVSLRESVSYGKMRESLIVLLKRSPSHKEVVEWLKKCSKAHRCGFHYLFSRDGIILMAEN